MNSYKLTIGLVALALGVGFLAGREASVAAQGQGRVLEIRTYVTPDHAGLDNLVKRMKDESKIFDRLDLRILVELANKMNPRRMSDILGVMTPEAAERLTIEIANRSGAIGGGNAPVAPELPKIEGRPNKS